MSPLFQLFYSTAYSLDESLIPTGFIQLFIPMAALIWSHFLFNNCNCSLSYSNCFIQLLFNFLFRWPPLFGRTFYSTTVLFNCLSYSNCFIQLLFPPFDFIQLFILMAALIWSHFLFNFLFLFNLNGRPYLVTLILSSFFFFFLWKKRCLPGIRTRYLLISSLDAYR